jgi:hypothetical protein
MEEENSPDKVSLSYKDLAEFVEPKCEEDKKVPAALEQKKWLFEKRLEYARSFFDHHAKQRMSMFNFFLLFVAFAISGYASLLKEEKSPVAMWIAIFGAALTICFLALDRRNEELVHISEDVLRTLENEVLFRDFDRRIPYPMRRTWYGRMQKRPAKIRPLGIFRRQTADQQGMTRPSANSDETAVHYAKIGNSWYQHGVWLPLFQVLIFVMFVALAVFARCPRLLEGHIS